MPVPAVRKARALRRSMSQAELTLWTGLRRANMGPRFRRQHPEPPYTLDFYCSLAKLAVEVDGVLHSQPAQARHDARRDAELAARGILTYRVSACDVMHHTDAVLRHIAVLAHERVPR